MLMEIWPKDISFRIDVIRYSSVCKKQPDDMTDTFKGNEQKNWIGKL